MNIFLYIICLVALTYMLIKKFERGTVKKTDSVGEPYLIKIPIRRKEDV